MAQNAETIFRDFVSDGVPSSGANMPKKVEIREWGTYIEQLHAAAQAGGGVVFQTKAAMTLGYAANQIAWVVADPIAASNGIYQKQGGSGSGSWTRVADLPYSFIRASNSGAGAANAIVATTGIPLPAASYGALILMNVASANSGPVTLAINGAAAKPLVTISGNALAAGYLLAGMLVAFVDAGTNFRLLTDVASSAIQAASEAAAIAAKADADRANAAAGVAVGAMTTVIDPQFATKATAEAFRPVLAPDYIRTAGYAAAGDGGGALYKKVAVQPTHAGKLSITLLGGAVVWYELADTEVIARNFNIIIAPADSTGALQSAINYSAAKANGPVYLPSGDFVVGDVDLKGVSLIGTGKTTLKIKSGASAIVTDGTIRAIRLAGITLDGAGNTGKAFSFDKNIGIRLDKVDLCNWGDRVAYFEQGTRDVRVSGGRVYDVLSPDVFCVKGRNSVFNGVAFRNCKDHVIRFGRFTADVNVIPSGTDGTVTGCSFVEVGNDPILYELNSRYGAVIGNTFESCRRIVKCSGVDGVNSMANITVANNVFHTQIGVVGAVINGPGVRGMVVTGNYVTNAQQGAYVGEDSVVSGNVFDTLSDNGIISDGSGAVISNNVLRDVAGAAAIRVIEDKASISGNRIQGSGGGVLVSKGDTIVTGNTIAVAGIGVRLLSTATQCYAVYNHLRNTTGTKVSDAGTSNVTTPNII